MSTREELLAAIASSNERIQTAVNQCKGNPSESDTLLRSDIDNAVRHALRIAKSLRLVKRTIFPVVEKKPSVNGTTAEEKTDSLPFEQ